jgi:hypothetical protein
MTEKKAGVSSGHGSQQPANPMGVCVPQQGRHEFWAQISAACQSLQVSVFPGRSITTEKKAGMSSWHRSQWPPKAMGVCVPQQEYMDRRDRIYLGA